VDVGAIPTSGCPPEWIERPPGLVSELFTVRMLVAVIPVDFSNSIGIGVVNIFE
jgi:hypothetical protein